MAVGFYNNWDNVLNKIQSLLRVEFGNSLKIYKDIRNTSKEMQYVLIKPVSSSLIEYYVSREHREFGVNIVLYFKQSTIKQTDIDQIMRLVSRIETVIANNNSMTLSDGSSAYDCRIEETAINSENIEEYIVTIDFRCTHNNDISSDTTSPTMTITASQISDGDKSPDTTLSMTFTSSENTTDFVVGDITLGNSSLGTLTNVDGSVYTATLTPSAEGAVTVDVAADKFSDNAGNLNTAATQFNWEYVSNNYSVSIDGTDEAINCGSPNFSSNDVGTIAVWTKIAEAPSGDLARYHLLSYVRTGDLKINLVFGNVTHDEAKWYFNIKTGSEAHYNRYSTSPATVGEWVHLVGVQDGSAHKLYVNGSLQTGSISSTASGFDRASSEWFDVVGASQASGDFNGLCLGSERGYEPVNGLIDNAAIWSVALDADDVLKIYNSGASNDLRVASSYNTDRTGGLIGYWRCEEGTGTSIADDSSNSNTGSFVNSVAWSTDRAGI